MTATNTKTKTTDWKGVFADSYEIKNLGFETRDAFCRAIALGWLKGESGYDEGDIEDCIDIDSNVIFTDKSLDEVYSDVLNNWVSGRGSEVFTSQERPGRYWESVQQRKGQQRTAMMVLDMGDYRLIYKYL